MFFFKTDIDNTAEDKLTKRLEANSKDRFSKNL